jgi:hypothetical protein
MLHTTLAKCKENNACKEGYRKLVKTLGGVTKYGRNTPIPLDKIVESNGLDDALWTLRCLIELIEVSEKIVIEFTCRCAEHTLVNYEKLYPHDMRPREAIEAARRLITDKSESARSAAWSAARSAGSAAESAEKDWQTKTFLELLNG